MWRSTLFYPFNLDTPTEQHYKLKMDKIGEANKPFKACVEDMNEDEGNKLETVPAPADDEEKGIDTKVFLMTEMKFVFQMNGSILPGEMVPAFYCKGQVGDSKKMVCMEDYKGTFIVLVFTYVGDATLNLILGS